MRKTLTFGLLALAAAATLGAAEPPVQTEVFLSKVYTIDKKYRSMEGPGSIDQFFLGDRQNPELLWVTRIKTEMVTEDGRTPQLPELMCHVNVDLDPTVHSAMFDLKRYTATRLITLSQGMLDARLPAGSAFPLASNEPLSIFTQVLNLNIEHPNNLKVRHRVTFEYIRDRDLTRPLRPLFNVGASGTVILADGQPAMPQMAMAEITGAPAGSSEHGVSCLVGSRAPNAVAGGGSDYTDPQGRKLTGHWVVPPGRQVNHSDITWFMALPFDANLYWAAAHLHPFAKSLSIIDATTGKTVFKVAAEGPKQGIGLTHVETFSSDQGVPMYRNHKYELISEYDNTTSENSDSMASAFLALGDPEFVRPDRKTLAARADALFENDPTTHVVMRTSVGDFSIDLLRDLSPNAVKNFLRLVRSGAYDHARMVRTGQSIEIETRTPTSASGRPALLPHAQERAVKHTPGMLSSCSDSSEAFAITLIASPDRDERCTAFGRIAGGAPVVRLIGAPMKEGGAPVEILKVEIFDRMNTADMNLAPARAGM